MVEKKKIGVLLPQSSAYPLMGKDFINGLKLGLGEAPVQLVIESIGFGSEPKQLTSAVQKLCFQEDVALTTGLFGHYGFSELAEFVSTNEEILLAATLGATETLTTPKGVYQNSLGLCESLHDLTNYFAETNIKNVTTSSCYYESGYGFFTALENGMKEQETVQFAGHFITPHHPRENEAEIMNEVISSSSPDAVVAFHNSLFAKEHASYLQKNQLQKQYPIYCLPFSCEDDLINEYKDVFKDIKIVSSWFPELENNSNKAFILAYQAKHHKNPSFFALLGYENALIIKAALENTNGLLNEQLENVSIEGPRGTLNFEFDKRKTHCANYLWEIDENTLEKRLISPLKPNNLDIEISHNNNGWYNAYLCH